MEAVVGVAAFSLVGTAVISGLSTTQISSARAERQSIAENLGRNQMESVFSEPYSEPPSSYTSVPAPPGYGVTAVADEYVPGDTTIEMIIVTVTHGGADVLVLETLRADELRELADESEGRKHRRLSGSPAAL